MATMDHGRHLSSNWDRPIPCSASASFPPSQPETSIPSAIRGALKTTLQSPTSAAISPYATTLAAVPSLATRAATGPPSAHSRGDKRRVRRTSKSMGPWGPRRYGLRWTTRRPTLACRLSMYSLGTGIRGSAFLASRRCRRMSSMLQSRSRQPPFSTISGVGGRRVEIHSVILREHITVRDQGPMLSKGR